MNKAEQHPKTIEEGGDDLSVSNSDSHATGTNDQSNKSFSMSVDKDVLRSKTAAFIVLGLAAVGLGFMTFFLTRSGEIDDFESQVSPVSQVHRLRNTPSCSPIRIASIAV